MKNVLFIIMPCVVETHDARDTKLRSFAAIPFGSLSIASYCKQEANFTFIDFNVHPLELLDETVAHLAPGIIAISMTFNSSYQHLKGILETIREITDAPIVLGGAAVSFSYKEILERNPQIEAVCFGEGELAFKYYLTQHNFRHPSWITHNQMVVGKIPELTLVENLDEVIDIDYSLINPEDYNMTEAFSPFERHEKQKQFFIHTSRGCIFSCHFCNNYHIHGKKMRYASVDRVIGHIEYLIDNYGMNVLTIEDDQILYGLDRAKEFFHRMINYGIRIEMPNGLSVAYIDEELAILMRAAGVDTVYLAIESGNAEMLKKLRKPLKLEQIKPAVDALNKYGFHIHAFLVMGTPGETTEMRWETAAFIKSVGVHWAGINVATPVRGSALYDECIENNWIESWPPIEAMVDKKYVIRIPWIDADEVARDMYLVNLDINFVNNYYMRVGKNDLAAICFENVMRRYKRHAFCLYYLAKCGVNTTDNMEKFNQIIAEDEVWRGYAKHFNLI